MIRPGLPIRDVLAQSRAEWGLRKVLADAACVIAIFAGVAAALLVLP